MLLNLLIHFITVNIKIHLLYENKHNVHANILERLIVLVWMLVNPNLNYQ